MSDDQESELKGLMLQALEGNAAAYHDFLEQTGAILRGFLGRIMGPRQRREELIEDLVQDSLLAIHRKRDLYSRNYPILPWIYAIARHKMIDGIRAEARRPQGKEWDYNAEAETATTFAEHMPEQGEYLLKGLKEKQIRIINSAKLEGTPIAEIAEKEKMSISAVRVSIHRSLEVMRRNAAKRKAS